MPEVPSTPECERDRVNRIVSCSSGRLSTGDHPPPILPATMPAIAAAGPNTEFEAARFLLRAFSGLDGDDVSVSDTA